MKYIEANFDGLVGPTHNYAGLSFGNVASQGNASQKSNPKAAAKQGLKKAKALLDLGLVQGILPPQERPSIELLKRIGFHGTEANILEQAYKQAPELLQACCSASSMWCANAATVSPSCDTLDGKLHLTPANLVNKLHRSIEPKTTGDILKAIFSHENFFCHHQHLPEHAVFGDEGAANHTRLCQNYGDSGLEIFVYGQSSMHPRVKPQRYPARQTLEASQAIARLHQLNNKNTVYIQQNPDLIDQGVFHNDVIAVGNKNVLFYHELAYLDTQQKFDEIHRKLNGDMHFIEVPSNKVSIDDAIETYLFNTQLVSLPNGDMVIIAPTDCRENNAVHHYLTELITLKNPIKQVKYLDVKQSMKNGGGPACLRLRVVMNETELANINQRILLNENLFKQLNTWIDKHYRDEISINDLADPQLLFESRSALDELTQIMQLGSIYHFQH